MVNTGQPGKVRKQLAGLPDVLVWWQGHHFAIECKEGSDRVRPSQEAFIQATVYHTGENVHVVVVRSVEEMEYYCKTCGIMA